MVIVKLMGGLGNQMFQYACAKRLAVKNNTDLLLDTWFLDRPNQGKFYTSREFELDVFQLKNLKAPEKVIRKFYKKDIMSRLFLKISGIQILKEQGDYFEPSVLEAPSSIYLVGFWQSEKYFYGISDLIKGDFSFPDAPENNYVAQVQNEIFKYQNSVSVHIRRGDYVKNKKGLPTKFENLTIDYYNKAIQLIRSKLDDVHFFFFSDEPDDVIENFHNLKDATIIKHNQTVPNYLDMKLMSYCSHNIIANSSYSWWAAWLNGNSSKTVIAPKTWFVRGDNDRLIDERLPKSWMTL